MPVTLRCGSPFCTECMSHIHGARRRATYAQRNDRAVSANVRSSESGNADTKGPSEMCSRTLNAIEQSSFSGGEYSLVRRAIFDCPLSRWTFRGAVALEEIRTQGNR